jgi:hypothetical protein
MHVASRLVVRAVSRTSRRRRCLPVVVLSSQFQKPGRASSDYGANPDQHDTGRGPLMCRRIRQPAEGALALRMNEMPHVVRWPPRGHGPVPHRRAHVPPSQYMFALASVAMSVAEAGIAARPGLLLHAVTASDGPRRQRRKASFRSCAGIGGINRSRPVQALVAARVRG